MSQQSFVHLHTHSEFSLLEGITHVNDMCDRAYELEMPALALTDYGRMFGAAAFYQAALSAGKRGGIKHGAGFGIKPILGCEIYFEPRDDLPRDGRPNLFNMVLLAENNQGYKNLMNLVSQSNIQGFYYKPRTTMKMLQECCEGIIATSAGIGGIIPKLIDGQQMEEALKWARVFRDLFGEKNFFLEVQDQGVVTNSGTTQASINKQLAQIADELGIGLVASNNMHYLTKADAYRHDLALCINYNKRVDDSDRFRFSSDEFYLKSADEMRHVLRDYPQACDETLAIADRCNVTLDFDQIVLPVIPLPEGETNETMLRKESVAGLERKYGDLSARPEVMQRFEHEYKIICDKGFPAYFLIVQDFVRWAKNNGIGVGPGRGSAAGSIISYALDITTCDPLANDLIFERFLSPERTEMPDIDIDFDDDHRAEVIDYVRHRYGHDKVAHVITYQTIKAKQAIRDAARILGQPVWMGDELSKMVSTDPKATLRQTLKLDEKKPNLFNQDFKDRYDADPNSRQIIDAALAIEGIARGEGVHASAVIICRDALHEHVPIKLDKEGAVEITQYDGVIVASLGLLKMDFLGLRTLTVIDHCCKNILKNHGITINPESLPMDDPKIFELFSSGQTHGVFQVESAGMRSLLKKMKPTEFKHIVALLALYRPGPLAAGVVDSYVDRMHGRQQVEYYDDRLRPILEDTYGAMVYQEQVMRISVDMSGFTLGESDKLRKAVAKKKIDLMTKTVMTWADGSEETMQEHWLAGAERNGYTREVAQRIWNDVLEFAEYAFNKSHSAAYGMVTMQTAWLKAHYRHEYMAAVLTSYTGKSDRIVGYIRACKQEGIPVLAPHVNHSDRAFTASEEGVRIGLAGIKGVGEGIVDAIVEQRNQNGPFADIIDFVVRMVTTTGMRRNIVHSLIHAGAFDDMGYTRLQMAEMIDDQDPQNIYTVAEAMHKKRMANQLSFLDILEDGDSAGLTIERPESHGKEYSRKIKLECEKQCLGDYISDHPLSPYAYLLANNRDYALFEIDEELGEGQSGYVVEDGTKARFSGIVTNLRVFNTKNGDKMAAFSLEDLDGEYSCVIFPRQFAKYKEVLGVVDGFSDAAMPSVGDDQSDQDVDVTSDNPYEPTELLVTVTARVERNDRGNQLVISSMNKLRATKANMSQKTLEICADQTLLNPQFMRVLHFLAHKYTGADQLVIEYVLNTGEHYMVQLPKTVNARSTNLKKDLTKALGAHGTFRVE